MSLPLQERTPPAPKVILLDDRDAVAELAQPCGKTGAAGPCADDDDVLLLL